MSKNRGTRNHHGNNPSSDGAERRTTERQVVRGEDRGNGRNDRPLARGSDKDRWAAAAYQARRVMRFARCDAEQAKDDQAAERVFRRKIGRELVSAGVDEGRVGSVLGGIMTAMRTAFEAAAGDEEAKAAADRAGRMALKKTFFAAAKAGPVARKPASVAVASRQPKQGRDEKGGGERWGGAEEVVEADPLAVGHVDAVLPRRAKLKDVARLVDQFRARRDGESANDSRGKSPKEKTVEALGQKIVAALRGERELPTMGSVCGCRGHGFCTGRADNHVVATTARGPWVMSFCDFAYQAYRGAGGQGEAFGAIEDAKAARTKAAKPKPNPRAEREAEFKRTGERLTAMVNGSGGVPSGGERCGCGCDHKAEVHIVARGEDGVNRVLSLCRYGNAAFRAAAGGQIKFQSFGTRAEAEELAARFNRPQPQRVEERRRTPQPGTRHTGKTARDREKKRLAELDLARAQAERDQRIRAAEAAKPENRLAAAQTELAPLQAEQAELEGRLEAGLNEAETARLEALWAEVPALEARISAIRGEIIEAARRKVEAEVAKHGRAIVKKAA